MGERRRGRAGRAARRVRRSRRSRASALGIAGIALLAGASFLASALPTAATGVVAHRTPGRTPADSSSPYGRDSSATPAPVPHLVAPPGDYANPVSSLDFPDPDVVESGGTYYAFGTGDADDNVSEMTTTDLGSWPDSYDELTDALPTVGSWATVSPLERVWAPSVIEVDGTWLLFYAAVDTDDGMHCIGVATSPTPAGPYQDSNAAPLVCQASLGGSIDPDAYEGLDGNLYLAWKSDDTALDDPATLWSQRLVPSADGVSVVGSPVALLTQDQSWETTIENPAMVVSGGRYLLLFSGGLYDTASYATGYAVCLGPQGPCREPYDRPVLASAGSVAGPGGASVFEDLRGELWVAYAAWTAPDVGYEAEGSRSLRIDPLCLPGGGVDILGPSTTVESLSPACSSTSAEGYQTVAADGGVFAYGAPFHGSAAGLALSAPIVATAPDPTTGGYWEVGADGGVFAFDAPFYGSMGGKPLDAPIVGMAPSPDGEGYWLVASDGGIFAFGDARFLGSMGGQSLNRPIVGMAVDGWSGGYWLVASDGGIFAFGAPFDGSMGGQPLNRPMVAMIPAVGGVGYWLVASDGGIFAFGDAPFLGSTGGLVLAAPIVGGASDGFGLGYWLVASDGGIFAFGSAGFRGSTGGQSLVAPMVGMLSP